MRVLTRTGACQRQGQSLFNFLEWLSEVKGHEHNQNARMADPFHLTDKEIDALWEEWLSL